MGEELNISLSITNRIASPRVLASQKHYQEEGWRENPHSHGKGGKPWPNSPCPMLPSSREPALCCQLTAEIQW